MIRYARLPLAFPLDVIQAEIHALQAPWKAHVNTAYYQGGWTVLALRAPGGNPEHIVADTLGQAPFADTSLMLQAPCLKIFLDSLPFPLWSVRLLRLSPGSVIKEHRDPDLSFEQGEARLHFPLFTHEGVAFFVEGEQVRMQEGECWYINANLPHRVSNPGPSERIHLVVDGPVTPGLEALFAQSDRCYCKAPEEPPAFIGEYRAQVLKNWIPEALVGTSEEWLCRWLDTGKIAFTDPFFHETIQRCRPQAGPLPVFSGVPSLIEWAETLPSVPPSAFIFHVSRCGSTLVSQLLGLEPAHIVLAEVPFVDDLFRAAFRSPLIPLPDLRGAVMAAFRFYGRQRSGLEERLFIKTDSWHILFFEQLRSWYPDVPCYLLYRAPEEVLQSHRKRRGMQSVPGMIEVLDIASCNDLDEYMGRVLEKYMRRFLDIAATDPLTHLVNYNEGIPEIVRRMTTLTPQMVERSRYHAKYPEQLFAEEATPPECPTLLSDLYQQLEAVRNQTPRHSTDSSTLC